MNKLIISLAAASCLALSAGFASAGTSSGSYGSVPSMSIPTPPKPVYIPPTYNPMPVYKPHKEKHEKHEYSHYGYKHHDKDRSVHCGKPGYGEGYANSYHKMPKYEEKSHKSYGSKEDHKYKMKPVVIKLGPPLPAPKKTLIAY